MLTQISLILALVSLSTLFIIYTTRQPNDTRPLPQVAKNLTPNWLSPFGALDFFTRRYDFLIEQIKLSKTGLFRFYLGKIMVVGISDGEAKHQFFHSNQLDFSEGYAALFNTPSPADVAVVENLDPTKTAYFNNRLIALVKRPKLSENLSSLLSVTQQHLVELGDSGVTDPFDSIYEIVFHLTVLQVGAIEIANDRAKLRKLLSLFETIENSSTYFTVLFPRIPGPARIKRIIAGTKLYFMLKKCFDDRAASGRREEDALQFLIDSGDSVEAATQFIVGSLFAGLLNSGINAAYILSYLGLNPGALARAKAEIAAVAERHSDDPSLSLSEKLLTLPIEVWEEEFVFLDQCLSDSARINAMGAGLRMVKSDTMVGDEVIPKGSIMAFPFHHTHLDPNLYPNPLEFDPSRYDAEREEQQHRLATPLSYLAWGAGRHPCLGMKFAKLENVIISALFLARFDYSLIDDKGAPLKSLGLPDLNQLSAKRPKFPVNLKYAVIRK